MHSLVIRRLHRHHVRQPVVWSGEMARKATPMPSITRCRDFLSRTLARTTRCAAQMRERNAENKPGSVSQDVYGHGPPPDEAGQEGERDEHGASYPASPSMELGGADCRRFGWDSQPAKGAAAHKIALVGTQPQECRNLGAAWRRVHAQWMVHIRIWRCGQSGRYVCPRRCRTRDGY